MDWFLIIFFVCLSVDYHKNRVNGQFKVGYAVNARERTDKQIDGENEIDQFDRGIDGVTVQWVRKRRFNDNNVCSIQRIYR